MSSRLSLWDRYHGHCNLRSAVQRSGRINSCKEAQEWLKMSATSRMTDEIAKLASVLSVRIHAIASPCTPHSSPLAQLGVTCDEHHV